jgi:hypothetical protein
MATGAPQMMPQMAAPPGEQKAGWSGPNRARQAGKEVDASVRRPARAPFIHLSLVPPTAVVSPLTPAAPMPYDGTVVGGNVSRAWGQGG